ncbi:hypothetical protein D9M72_331270 [compost metagenome]
MSAQQVGQRGCSALVSHVDHVGARGTHEDPGRQVLRVADARGAEAELAGPGLQPSDQLCNALNRHVRGIDDEHVGLVRHPDYRRQVLEGIEWQLQEQVRIGGHAERGHHQCVAILRCLGDHIHADVPAGAGPVVHDDRLAKLIGQFLANQPSHHVDASAWREWHHHPDRLGREILGCDRALPQSHTDRERCNECSDESLHDGCERELKEKDSVGPGDQRSFPGVQRR